MENDNLNKATNIDNNVLRYPSSVESEEKAIACLLSDNELFLNALNLTVEDFYSPLTGTIFSAMKEIYDNFGKVSIHTLIEYLKNHNKYNNVSKNDYLLNISSLPVSSLHFDEFVRTIKEASLKRNVMDCCNNIMKKANDPEYTANTLIDLAEEKIFNVSKKRIGSEFVTVGEVANKYFNNVMKMKDTKKGLTGLDTGFVSLNQISNGLQKEDLIIIGARPAMGKSAFALQIALNVAMPKLRNDNSNDIKHVAFFSLEMSNEQIVTRIISNIGAIKGINLKSPGSLSPNDLKSFATTVNLLEKFGLHFDDTSTSTIGDIRSKCRKLQQKGKLDLVIIDYLQLLKLSDKVGSSFDRVNTISEISRMLKLMAKELKIPVIALSQLSRKVEERAREDRRPKLADLRESGSIEQDADIVIFLYRPEYYEKDKAELLGKVEVLVEKNRQGISGVKIDFNFLAEYSKFKEYINEPEYTQK